MIAPIDFIREKYIEPNHITQDMLCKELDIGKKTISELYQHKRGFTLHTAKKFAQFFNIKVEFIMMKQLEYDLANDKQEYADIKPFEVIRNEDKKLNIALWILASVNNSISDVKMHYSVNDLYEILHNLNKSKQYYYAILTLFKEVDFNDVLKYCELFNIDKNNLKTMYEFYKEEFIKEDIKEYEWLFKEL